MTTIVMTGGTSGLGRVAAERMIKSRGARVILGARSAAPSGAEVLPLELTKLDSVRTFAAQVGERLGPTSIDTLVLNAGLSFMTGDHRTADGFETTFAVNHLSHYLLLRLFMPKLATGATVVITTSGTHDPAEKTAIPPPRHANAHLLAHPDRDPDQDAAARTAGGRAYGASKLCNVLTARALAAQPQIRSRRISVIAFDPGPTPGTGLVRNSGAAINLMWKLFGSPLRVLVPRFNSREAAGSTLADIALGKLRPAPGEYYGAVRKGRLQWQQPSELARRDDVMHALWRDSAALVGISE